MEMDDETWHLVKEVPKVLGFIGGVIFFALDFFLGWVVTRITGQGSL
jgi:hypothetical protein